MIDTPLFSVMLKITGAGALLQVFPMGKDSNEAELLDRALSNVIKFDGGLGELALSLRLLTAQIEKATLEYRIVTLENKLAELGG